MGRLPSYSKGFKKQAVQRALLEDRPMAEIAGELGIKPHRLLPVALRVSGRDCRIRAPAERDSGAGAGAAATRPGAAAPGVRHPKKSGGRFDLRVLCVVPGVSRSGYYRWRRGPAAGRSQYPEAAPVQHVLQRRCDVARPDQIWAADLTYIPTAQGWLYLAVVMDLGSRRIIGWSMAAGLETDTALEALRMAILQRKPGGSLLHHSDRGLQYSSGRYQDEIARHAIQPSYSPLGDCWDNPVVESFFHTLKVELLRGRRLYLTRSEARDALFDYIEGWYNRQRRHSTRG